MDIITVLWKTAGACWGNHRFVRLLLFLFLWCLVVLVNLGLDIVNQVKQLTDDLNSYFCIRTQFFKPKKQALTVVFCVFTARFISSILILVSASMRAATSSREPMCWNEKICKIKSIPHVTLKEIIIACRNKTMYIFARYLEFHSIFFTLASNSLNCLSLSCLYFSISSWASSLACFSLRAFPGK